jgi:hypothetical protein
MAADGGLERQELGYPNQRDTVLGPLFRDPAHVAPPDVALNSSRERLIRVP